MRARKRSWVEDELINNKTLIQNPAEHKGQWSKLFGNDNPIHLEIGCGKGKFIAGKALQCHDINFIAMEREIKVIVNALKTSREAGVCNVFFINCDAEELTKYFSDKEIKRIYLNFSDPWPSKRKWAKKRLTHRNFLEVYEQILDGEVHMKTDNTGLFEFSLNEFCDYGWRLKNISLDLHKTPFHTNENIMTEYEEKFSELGQPIYRLEARR